VSLLQQQKSADRRQNERGKNHNHINEHFRLIVNAVIEISVIVKDEIDPVRRNKDRMQNPGKKYREAAGQRSAGCWISGEKLRAIRKALGLNF
jgi:hypothetical protein